MAINTESELQTSQSMQLKTLLALFIVLGVFIGVIAISFVSFLNTPTDTASWPRSVTVEPGTSVKQITQILEEEGVVRSKELLYFALTLLNNPEDIKASTYVFEEPLTTLAVAKRLVAGDFDSDLIKFTHFEGERATHIATEAAKKLENFDTEAFLARAVPLEGKLYPETYFIPKTFAADELVDLMLASFEKHVQPELDRNPTALTTEEVLILASILEREANSPESMRMVSDILQRRMKEGMPLQADASIEYILDKPLKELTPDDLKIDSPYNTYLNRGLPPTPIGNPGIDAVQAVLNPTSSNYVFYITDNEGNFHYATTYDEHLNNIERYLR
jgi:UPF0755 protein